MTIIAKGAKSLIKKKLPSSNRFEPFEAISIDAGVVTIKKGRMRFVGGILQTGNITKDFPENILIDLVDVEATPVADTSYWLCVDTEELGSEVTFTDTAAKAFLVYQASHFKVLAKDLSEINTLRYIPLVQVKTTVNWSDAVIKTITTRNHYDLGAFIPLAEKVQSTHNVAGTKEVNHGFSQKPEIISLFFWDDSESDYYPIDYLSYITNMTDAKVDFDFSGLTFDTGDYVDIFLYFVPNVRDNLVAATHTFRSPWFIDDTVVEVAHKLSDMDDIASHAVQEWNVSDGERRLLNPSALVSKFDDEKFYLDWSGLVPSSNLRYRIVTGGSALPQALPVGPEWQTVSAIYTAKNKDLILGDTSSGAFTISLPANPTVGMIVKLADAAGTWDTNNLTIGRNGSNIESVASDLTLDVPDVLVKLIYIDDTIGWKVF